MPYMLDTNICGYIIRDKPIYIKDKFKEIEKTHEITLSSIVVSELLYEALKKKSPKLTKLVKSFISGFTIHDFDETAAFQYAIIRKQLELSGKIIGSNDLFISAHAKALDAILVTNNLKEFARVDTLKLENWIND